MLTKYRTLLGVMSLLVLKPVFADPQTITGAGATFPYPLYVKWAQAYQQQTNVNVNYQPIGSGGGIQQIKAKTVDFGASDKPLSNADLQQNNLTQFPTAVGGVVVVVNLKNLAHPLTLSGPVLADIYLGNIKQWNDAKISALNPGIQLPNQAITVVHRADGSGTTFLFTHYLSQINPTWQTKVGSDTAVAWPVGVGAKGSEGVSAYVQRIPGSIGYVEYAYAHQNHLNFSQLKNQAGEVVSPSLNTFAEAASHAHWSSQNHFAEILTNEPGAHSWPITGATFVLINGQSDISKTTEVLRFFAWGYQHGASIAASLDYVPLPDSAISSIQTEWQKQYGFSASKPNV